MPKLLIHEGGQQSLFDLLDDETTIGRGASNGVQVADPHASKHHAVIRRLGHRLKMVDLESKNGTRVNGEFRNQRWLEHGDVVAIGALTMTYDASDAVAAPAAPRPAVTVASTLISGPAVAEAPPAAAPAAPARHRRPRADDGHDDDREERRGRVPARRGSNSMAIGIMVALGVLGLIGILIAVLSHSGAGSNAMALRQAQILYQQDGNPGRALAYLRQFSDPNDESGYVSVRAKIKEWEAQEALQPAADREAAADAAWKQLERDNIERGRTGWSDEEAGRQFLKFLDDHKGTVKAMRLENLQSPEMQKLRALMERAKAAAPR